MLRRRHFIFEPEFSARINDLELRRFKDINHNQGTRQTPLKPKPSSSFTEENYRIDFPLRESNIPRGISKADVLAIEQIISTRLSSRMMGQLHYPRECFLTRYEDGFKFNRRGGPAITYFSGIEEYWIRGKRISDHITERLFRYDHYKMSIRDILTYPNIETRRDIMELLGSEQLAKMMASMLMPIHSDYLNNQLYTLYKTKEPIVMDGYQGFDMYFIHVNDASTSREYYLQVPPMSNALDAVAWTFYETKETYHPRIET
jgi:hypothetical protein